MRTLLLSAILFVSISSFCQISTVRKLEKGTSVGKIAPMGAFIAELSYDVGPAKDTTYTLMFNDATYSKIDAIKSVHFSGTEGTAEKLYEMFKSVFSPENKKNKDYIVTATLGMEQVIISNFKSMGVVSAMFTVNGAFFTLVEKQVDKLFGK